MENHLSAVFASRMAAGRVVAGLRKLGIPDSQLSIVTRQRDPEDVVVAESDAALAGKGLLAGASLGGLFGLAAAFIPGVGPFIAAGAWAASFSAFGASAAAGAAVGATSGLIGGALLALGYAEPESRFYGDALEQGGVLVAADLTGTTVTPSLVHTVFQEHAGGMSALLV
ncbi:MAG: hypothetical protein H7338_24205 [Candidatus Sericytochromatia bacterium]|nr:hypothetical protein [Candidatus Sericytochromatia bacterium]